MEIKYMSIEDAIKEICEQRNTIYKDYRHTIYYKAMQDYFQSHDAIYFTFDNIIKIAKEYALNKVLNDEEVDSTTLVLLEEIMESDNEDAIEIVMSLIAEHDNIKDCPPTQLLQLHAFAIGSDKAESDADKRLDDMIIAIQNEKAAQELIEQQENEDNYEGL